jgi:hypothetical protein
MLVKFDYVDSVNDTAAQAVLDASSGSAFRLPRRPEGTSIMKKLHLVLAALVASAAGAAQAQVTVGASVNINVPGVYGRVDIGAPGPGVAYVAPPVVYAEPVVIAPTPVTVQQRPIYLYVPEWQQRDWRHHCGAYGACGQRVYFVRETWVRDRYVQHHPHDHRYDHWEGEHDHGHHGHDRDDDRDHDGDHGHGHGHGHH